MPRIRAKPWSVKKPMKDFKEEQSGNAEMIVPLDMGVPDNPLQELTFMRSEWLETIKILATESIYSAATIAKIADRFLVDYAYSRNTTRVYLHRLWKTGWLSRVFLGGYRLSASAERWLEKQKEAKK